MDNLSHVKFEGPSSIPKYNDYYLYLYVQFSY